jgi:hypothetical protein
MASPLTHPNEALDVSTLALERIRRRLTAERRNVSYRLHRSAAA